jgi:hypothetical protein
MRASLRLIVCLASAAVAAGVCHGATVTYLFNGVCADIQQNCVGNVTASLSVADYTQGDQLTPANFVHFTYQSNRITIDSGLEDFFHGILPVTLPAPADVSLENELGVGPYEFTSQVSGRIWQVDSDRETDSGALGIWSLAPVTKAVPEPEQTLPLAIALTALAVWRFRRRVTFCSAPR